MRDISTDLGKNMYHRPRPSGSHEFLAKFVKINTDAVVEPGFETFSNKNRTVVESDNSEAGHHTELGDMGVEAG